MNSKRREKLNLAVDYLSQAKRIVDKVIDDEQDSLDNMPENLESSEQFAKMENAIDSMESASELIDESIGQILEAKT